MIQSLPNEVHFAIADLDGDRKPDLALVQVQSQRWANSNYSIRLQLSAGTESAIGVNAPLGGLRVAARDVNGDDSIDLILTSNLDGRFLEVLLNDGHGNFSVAAPGTYTALEDESPALLTGPAPAVADQATLAFSRSSFGEASASGYDCHTALSPGSPPLRRDRNALRQIAHSRMGRSPPVFLSLS